MNLTEKVAFITGAGSGIGKAAAIEFSNAGAKLVVVSDTFAEVEKTASEIGNDALALKCDVSDHAQVAKAVAKAIEKFGRIDVVFANAGINGILAPIEEISAEEWDKTIDVNLKGTFLTIRYTVPILKKQGGGSIIVTSSINGTRYFANSGATAYAASKAAQLAMVQMLAVELGPSNIRINAICPGAIDTEIKDNSTKRNVDKIKIKVETERAIPLSNHPGSAQQVAKLALFLASDDSSHITGTPIWIDGAQSLLA